jgi:hypothetical protein
MPFDSTSRILIAGGTGGTGSFPAIFTTKD